MKWFAFGRETQVPRPWGPHVPGCCDIMTEGGESSLFVRLWYPAEAKSEATNKGIPWLPDEGYMSGVARVLHLWTWIVRIVVWLMSGELRVPAVPKASVSRDPARLKCIVFSHGLGGNRFLYTSTCTELASHGYLVAAIEHRDGSACRTYWQDTNGHKTWMEHRSVPLGSRHYDMRNAQVQRRALELIRVLELLRTCDRGQPPHDILSQERKDDQFSLKQLADRLDLQNVTLMGHSFGAASALTALAGEGGDGFKQAVLLDTWMFPLKSEQIDKRVNHPLLFVNTQTFHIASNVRSLQPLLEGSSQRDMFTIRGTTHESQTDSVFVVGRWLNWFMKKLDAELALRINSALVLRFLQERTGHNVNTNQHNELLRQNAQHFYSGLTQPWA